MSWDVRRTLPAFVAAAAFGALLLPANATAGVARPAAPSGMRIVAVTPSSFTVAVNRTAHATQYRLYASTVRSDLFARNLANAIASPVSKSPRMTISGLTQRSKPYFYRVKAMHRHRLHYSETIGEVGLQPAKPSALVATASTARSFLSWQSGAATGYRIEQASNAAMTAHRKTYTMLGSTTSFTPYGLTRGTTYWFRVRALNQATPSVATAPVSMRVKASHQPVRVMTYNILEHDFDGRQEGGGVVAPWSQRRLGVVGFIEQSDPGVIAIQEGAAWMHGIKSARQVDNLKSALGGAYALARTEIPPTEHYYHRTGDYILYRKDLYAAVGTGDHWSLGHNHWAAHQVLRTRSSGAKFLFVCAHLVVGRGHADDVIRQQQTQRLVKQARSYAAAHGDLPIVYAGDYNSDQFNHHPDGPAVAMKAAGVPSAYNVAQRRANGRFNTSNQYQRRPPQWAAHMDEVFVPRGIAVRSWRQLLHVARGKFLGVIPSDHNPVVVDLEIPY